MAEISFELFPPRTPEGEQRLWQTIDRLAEMSPSFVSVTSGAGGASNRHSTLDVLRAIVSRTEIPAAGHLTCVGRSRAEVDAQIMRYWHAGVRQIVALRGDAPDGGRFEPHPDGYASAVELVAAVRRIAPIEVSVAAYPEPHPDSLSMLNDLAVLARKADAGATRAITQFCFESDPIVRLRDRIAGAGIELTVVPGILLGTDFAGVARMAQRCGASVPGWLRDRFAGLEEDLPTRKLVAAIVAAEQVDRLRREGFEHFHFYTLNQSDLAPAVCRLLDVPVLRSRVGAA
jgi:methylenetetrahydrofolate reductase (NADPH)